jgi:hypothetical protein
MHQMFYFCLDGQCYDQHTRRHSNNTLFWQLRSSCTFCCRLL